MVDHTLIDVPSANVYLDFRHYKGHCKVMCVSSPVYPVIIGREVHARCCQTQTGRLKSRKELKLGPVGATTMSMTTKVVICLVGCTGVQQSGNKTRYSKKKPAQTEKNDNHATQDVKVQEGTMKERVFAGPCLTRAQVKKSDKIQPLKVKEAMLSVKNVYHRRSSEEGFYSEESFDRVGKLIIRENYVGKFFMKNGLLYRKHQETKTGRS